MSLIFQSHFRSFLSKGLSESRSVLREAENDASPDAQGVLDVGGAVGKLSANPVSLEGTNRKVPRQADIDTAAYLQGERVVVGRAIGWLRPPILPPSACVALEALSSSAFT